MEKTLPYSWYVDPEILRREQERIFRSRLAVRRAHRRAAGARHVLRRRAPGRTPVVVTRARDGELRAFLNVCRHRGFPVAEGAGKRETIQCPYHAWTYGLDGSLRAAPRSEEEPDFPTRRARPLPRRRRHVGPVRLREHARATPSRSRTRSARCRRRSPSSGSTSTRSSSTRAGRPSSTRTGRSSARTSSSATTARSRIRSSRRCSTSRRRRTRSRPTAGSRASAARRAKAAATRMHLDGELPRGQFHFLWPNLGVNIFPGRPNISIGPMVPAHARPDLPLPRLLLRPRRRPGVDRRADGVRRPGRDRGPAARRGRPPRHRARRRSSTAT